MKGIRLLALSILAAGALSGCGDDDPTGPNGNGNDLEFEFTGTIAPGDRIEIKGVIGEITAALASGNQVEVRATKSAQQSDPAEVTIEVVEHSEGVTICAVYPDVTTQRVPARRRGQLERRGQRRSGGLHGERSRRRRIRWPEL